MKTNDYVKLVARLNQGNPATGGLGNLRSALNTMPLNKLNKVLEIGCNTGSSTIALGEMLPTSEVIGIDIDSDMIKMAKNNVEEAEKEGVVKPNKVLTELGDARKLPYPNNTFDLVVSSGALSFVDNRELAIKEIYRVLKPGGFLLTTDYFSKENQSLEMSKKVSDIIGVDVSETTLDYWIKLHSSQPFNIEGIETKNPLMHAIPTKIKIDNLRKVLGQQNRQYDEKDIDLLRSHLELFKLNEKYVGVINLTVRKLELLSLLSDGMN